jgi:hypothetical protein
MKKIPILIVLAAFCHTGATAQILQAHAAYSQGTHTNVVAGDVFSNTVPTKKNFVSAPTGRVSYGAGVTGRFGYADVKPFFAQVELSGFYQKASFEVRDSATSTLLNTYTKERFRLDAPIQLGLKFWWLRIQGGIVPSLPIPEKENGATFDKWWTDAFNTANIAYTYGVGLDIMDRVSLDLRYQNDFGQRIETTYVNDFGAKARHYYANGMLVAKLGVRISKDKE